jgi:hypothetical protein
MHSAKIQLAASIAPRTYGRCRDYVNDELRLHTLMAAESCTRRSRPWFKLSRRKWPASKIMTASFLFLGSTLGRGRLPSSFIDKPHLLKLESNISALTETMQQMVSSGAFNGRGRLNK